MKNSKIYDCIKNKFMKKTFLGAVLTCCFVSITMISGTKIVHAATNTWSATLPSFERYVNTGRDYYYGVPGEGEYGDDYPTAKVSLTRIVGGPSYYMEAHMANSDGASRTDPLPVRQGAGLTAFKNCNLTPGHYYNLIVANNSFETTARSAYGYISGFYTID